MSQESQRNYRRWQTYASTPPALRPCLLFQWQRDPFNQTLFLCSGYRKHKQLCFVEWATWFRGVRTVFIVTTTSLLNGKRLLQILQTREGKQNRSWLLLNEANSVVHVQNEMSSFRQTRTRQQKRAKAIKGDELTFSFSILHLIAFIHLEFQIPRALLRDRRMPAWTTRMHTDIWSQRYTKTGSCWWS